MKQSNLGPGMLHVFLSAEFVAREARNPRAVMEVETVKRVGKDWHWYAEI